MPILFWILLAVFVLGFLVPAFGGSYIIFSVLLVRTKPEKWGHSYSMPGDSEIVSMFDTGVAWREAHVDRLRTVEIVNDGLKLYGEYFDLGSDKTVIILAGRMECCVYSLYFAAPYEKAGYNVLVIDGRAHGLSEGKYNCIGYKECKDLLAWGNWLHTEIGCEHILLHGICIGACTSMLAITDPACPSYFRGIVVEGMFSSFYESTKNHMKKDKRPLFPFLYVLMLYIRVILGVNAVTDGPYKRILGLNRPILFLHGKQDAYSLPDKAVELYESCPAPKKLTWFEKGGHSRLRINNTEQYDEEVIAFAESLVAAADSTPSPVASAPIP